jgi:hypothetical protein
MGEAGGSSIARGRFELVLQAPRLLPQILHPWPWAGISQALIGDRQAGG